MLQGLTLDATGLVHLQKTNAETVSGTSVKSVRSVSSFEEVTGFQKSTPQLVFHLYTGISSYVDIRVSDHSLVSVHGYME